MYWIIGLIIGLIILISLLDYFEIGFNCGKWDFGPVDQYDCKCIGIKNDGCPRGASCEGGKITCLGIVDECYKINKLNNTKEIISC